jgi:serine/threonine-protein kinase
VASAVATRSWGLFWPDLDGEHARGALRRSLYFLRRACGEDVIISRGEDDVGIRPDALWCDVAAFEAALDAGRHADALGLYAGDLLEGFYVAGAPAMEHWLDMERTRLRACAAKAAWAAADAAGSSGAGVSWARKAVDFAPDEDRGVCRLITLLDKSGDAAGAIRTYDDYAARLARDLDFKPSPETTSLVGAIRKRAVPVTVRARAAPAALSITTMPPPAGNVVAVCPFVVRGARDLEYLHEGMIDLLSSALDGAGDLRTLIPARCSRHRATSMPPMAATPTRSRSPSVPACWSAVPSSAPASRSASAQPSIVPGTAAWAASRRRQPARTSFSVRSMNSRAGSSPS